MADVNTTVLNQQLQATAQQLQLLTQGIERLLASQSNIARAQEAQRRAREDATNDLAEFSKQLRAGRKLNEQQEKLVQEAIKAKKAEIEAAHALEKAHRDQAAAIANNAPTDELERLGRTVTNAADRHRTASQRLQSATTAVNKSFSGLVKNVDWASLAVSWFGSAVTTAGKQVLSQNKANGGLVEGTGNLIDAMAAQQNEALKFKLDATTFANITNGARQMFNAMGGTSEGLKQLTNSVDRFTIMTGSFEEGLKLATQTANDFATKGIRPTMIGMEQYQNDLVALRRQTGLSVEQAHQLYNDVAGDAESIDMLRSARKEEREAILRSQRALIQQSIAAGMSAEQAREAAKMLNKMVAAKPLDRLRQAARVRALSGAMGIAGGEEAAQAITAGKRATPEQTRMLQEFSQRAANAMDQAAGQGLGTEIFATTLLDKLDLEQYYGKNSNFSTTLGDTLKSANADLSKQFIDATKDPLAKTALATAGIWEQAKLIASGQHWSGVVLSGIAAMVAVIAARGMVGNIGKLGGKLGIGGAVAGEGAAAGKAASGLGRTLGTAGKILGPAASLAYGAYEGYDEYQQTGKAGASIGKGVGSAGGGIAGGWGGALAGAALGTAILPGIGTVLGGLLGGLGGGIGGSYLGGKAGKAVGSQFDPDSPAGASPASTAPVNLPTTSVTKAVKDQTKAMIESNVVIESATTATASGIAQQVKQLDQSNDYLSTMISQNRELIDLQKKTLAASTLTDREKSDQTKTQPLRADTKFSSKYQYIG